jgi:hypothetical protein
MYLNYISMTLLHGLGCWLPVLLLAAATAAGGNPTPTAEASLQQCSPPYLNNAVQHLSEIIQFATVSDAEAEHHAVNIEEFHKLGAWLASTYADVWQHFQVEQVRFATTDEQPGCCCMVLLIVGKQAQQVKCTP